jgi:hypothetical protein
MSYSPSRVKPMGTNFNRIYVRVWASPTDEEESEMIAINAEFWHYYSSVLRTQTFTV